MFSVDTIVRETTCFYGAEGMALFTSNNSLLLKSPKNKVGCLEFLLDLLFTDAMQTIRWGN